MPTTPTVDELAGKLGLNASDVTSFKHGRVVTQERHASNDKDLCLLVAVTMPADIEKTWKFVTEEKVPECQEANLAQGNINLNTFELEGFKFDHGTHGHLSKFHMSKSEAKTFSHARDKDAAFKQTLSARAKSYWEKGLKGIESYDGKHHNVGSDLETANNAALKIIQDPKIRKEITVVPSKSQDPGIHSLTWSIVEGNKMTSIVLSHMILYKKGEEGFIAMNRKFYSGTDFDSSMITTGVIPTSDGKSAVFYVNHTFTASVAGFGGGAKKGIGRKMMKGKLVETMEKIQKALA